MKNVKIIEKKDLEKAVSRSSALENLSLSKAKKNTAIIQRLKKYGRAFTI